jgi:sulfate adenylyltransferase
VSLVPVHGGLDRPVNRTIPLTRKKALLAEAAGMPKISLTSADLATVYRIADGTLSPLTGPMKRSSGTASSTRSASCPGQEVRLDDPPRVPVTDAEAARSRSAAPPRSSAPTAPSSACSRSSPCTPGTRTSTSSPCTAPTRFDHPGGRIVSNDARTKLVGGELQALPPKAPSRSTASRADAAQTRASSRRAAGSAALAFQTRNPLHRAHEYALVYGLRAAHPPGLLRRRRPEPARRRAQGRRRRRRHPHATYMASSRPSDLLGQGDKRQELWGEGRVLRLSTTSSISSASTSRCSTAAPPRR